MSRPAEVPPGEDELGELMRRTRLSAPQAVPSVGPDPTRAPAPLPQQVFLDSLRQEVQHFLAHTDLAAEIEEERRLFDELKRLGERLNASDVSDGLPPDPLGPPLTWLKRALRRLLWPVLRLGLGPRLQRQSQFNTTLVQFQNAVAQLEARIVSVQRHYRAHQANLSKNLLRILDLAHQSDLRLNEKTDLLVEDLDRRILALSQDVQALAGRLLESGEGS